MINLSKAYKRKQKCFKIQKKGKVSVKPHSEVSQKSCLSLPIFTT